MSDHYAALLPEPGDHCSQRLNRYRPAGRSKNPDGLAAQVKRAACSTLVGAGLLLLSATGVLAQGTCDPDMTPPVWSAVPADTTVYCPKDIPPAANPVATDNCSNVFSTYRATIESRSCFSSYVLVRVWTASDVRGNMAQIRQTIRVIDDQAPVLSAVPADTSVQCERDIPAPPVVTAVDYCDDVFIRYREEKAFLGCRSSFILTRYWTAEDRCNNISRKTQRITVSDTQAPVLVGEPPASVTVGPGSVPPPATLVFSDQCGQLNDVDYRESRTDGACADSYVLTRTWVAYDYCSNFSKPIKQTITVVDPRQPRLSGVPPDATVACDAVPPAALVTAADGTGTPVPVELVETKTPGKSPNDYTLTRTWTAAGECNATATQLLTVVDSQKPVWSGVPAALTVRTDAGQCTATLALAYPPATDNCAVPTVAHNLTETNGQVTFPTGKTTIAWTATDASGNQATVEQTVTVADEEQPVIAAVADITRAPDAGSCGAVVTFAVPAVTDNCPGVTLVRTDGTGLQSGSVFPGGTTDLAYTATDAAGNATVRSFRVTVTRAVPTLTAFTAPLAPVPAGTVVLVSASFAAAGLQSAVWDWENGTTAGTVDPVAGKVTGSRIYSTPGVYTVGLTITDACGATAASRFQYVVVYDPKGGFVTGVGSIHSPAGAYKANPVAAGKASFGFVSRYQKGATVPTGKTNFQFKAVGFNFNSTAYEWLVVAGAKAKFKGEGTLNGAGRYGFLLSATDGQTKGAVDKLRIRIWDKNKGDVVIYDNNLYNTGDNADPATPISSGSIVVQEAKSKARLAYGSEAGPSAGIAVYPNPAVDKVRIDLQEMPAAEASTAVTDALGRTLLRDAHQAVGASLLELDVTGLPRGVYSIRVSVHATSKTVKFLKR
jgi:hypothetical protein